MLSGFVHAGQKNGTDKNYNKGRCPRGNQRRKAQGRAKDLHKVCEQKNGYGDGRTTGEQHDPPAAGHVGQGCLGPKHGDPDQQKGQGQQFVKMHAMLDRRKSSPFKQFDEPLQPIHHQKPIAHFIVATLVQHMRFYSRVSLGFTALFAFAATLLLLLVLFDLLGPNLCLAMHGTMIVLQADRTLMGALVAVPAVRAGPCVPIGA